RAALRAGATSSSRGTRAPCPGASDGVSRFRKAPTSPELGPRTPRGGCHDAAHALARSFLASEAPRIPPEPLFCGSHESDFEGSPSRYAALVRRSDSGAREHHELHNCLFVAAARGGARLPAARDRLTGVPTARTRPGPPRERLRPAAGALDRREPDQEP